MKRRRAPWTLLVLLVLLQSAHAAPPLRSDWGSEEARALADALLDEPGARDAAEARAPLRLAVARTDGHLVPLRYDGGAWLEDDRPYAPGAYRLTLSPDAGLTVLQAPDPTHALRCLVAQGHVQLASPRLDEQLALRAALPHVARGLTCHLQEGETVAFHGVTGRARPLAEAFAVNLSVTTEWLVVNELGAPLGWVPAGSTHTNGTSLLDQEEAAALAGAHDSPRWRDALARDPWRAAAAAEVDALLEEALQRLCAPPAQRVEACSQLRRPTPEEESFLRDYGTDPRVARAQEAR